MLPSPQRRHRLSSCAHNHCASVEQVSETLHFMSIKHPFNSLAVGCVHFSRLHFKRNFKVYPTMVELFNVNNAIHMVALRNVNNATPMVELCQ
jgi:hypothetical protein